LQSEGAGWLSSVRLAGDDVTGRFAAAPQRPRNGDKLAYYHLRYELGMEGNMLRRQVQFRDRVRVVYGPVANWEQKLDPDRRGGLGDQGVELTCDALTATEMNTGLRPHLELEAAGNSYVEGRLFLARADRLTYNESKDQLILQGDGRRDALLEMQKTVGGQSRKLEARKILFWPKTRNFDVQDARSLNLGPLGGQ
jgi:hypothetical protein